MVKASSRACLLVAFFQSTLDASALEDSLASIFGLASSTVATSQEFVSPQNTIPAKAKKNSSGGITVNAPLNVTALAKSSPLKLSLKNFPGSASFSKQSGTPPFRSVLTTSLPTDTPFLVLGKSPLDKIEWEKRTSFLPARFTTPFEITIYFTIMEEGISENSGYGVRDLELLTRTIDGKPVKAKRAFWNSVILEGMGKLENVQHGITYVGYDVRGRRFKKYSTPVGVANRALDPGDHCAIDPAYFNQGWEFQVCDPNIAKIFGGNTFVANDVGGAIKGYHLDLYLGDAKSAWRRSGLPKLPDDKVWYGGKSIPVNLMKRGSFP